MGHRGRDAGVSASHTDAYPGGDSYGDGDTAHSDLGKLLTAWCSHEGDLNWDPCADLDCDGHVGHGDLGIVLTDWGCGVEP